MDKLMDNRWVIRIIALLLALLLFTSVYFENQTKSNSSDGILPFSNYSDTLTGISVNTYYDETNLVVSGVPQYVNVSIEGPSGVTKRAGIQKEIEVFADLTELAIGTHRVKLQYRNISDKISVKIDPAEITVVISEKVTKEFEVEVDYVNKELVEAGYEVGQPVVKPNVVKITGAKEEIESIALVKAVVDLKEAKETIEQKSRVAVYDKNQNVLSVTVDPPEVNITVPIESPSKQVSFNLKQKGTLDESLQLVDVKANPSEVTIYGPTEIIETIDKIDDITIDLDDITEDTILEVDVPLPDGVKRVSPEKIQIKVDVEEVEKRTLTDIPIQTVGLAEGYSVSFLNPEAGTLDIEVSGPSSMINSISKTDIEISVDISDLEDGEHEVEIVVKGPDELSWEIPQDNALVQIAAID